MKPPLIGMSLILIAVVAAWIFTWHRLQVVESQLSEVGLHKVRIRCVDAIEGTILKPTIFGVPAPQADVVAMGRSGEVMVFWSGFKSDGDGIGAAADGYKATLLPPNWSETSSVEIQLTRPESNAEQWREWQPAIMSCLESGLDPAGATTSSFVHYFDDFFIFQRTKGRDRFFDTTLLLRKPG